MTIIPITPTTPACYGMCCPLHPDCQRYAAVNGQHYLVQPIVSCLDKGEYPMFVKVAP